MQEAAATQVTEKMGHNVEKSFERQDLIQVFVTASTTCPAMFITVQDVLVQGGSCSALISSIK